MWMVRSDAGRVIREFLDRKIIGIGFGSVDASQYNSVEEITKFLQNLYPEEKKLSHIVRANQIFKFAKEFKIDDPIITYDPSTRSYHTGRIEGDYEYNKNNEEGLHSTRKVKWNENPIKRDDLSPPVKNTLGATLTIFQLSEKAVREITALQSGHITEMGTDIESEEEAPKNADDIQGEAIEHIKDKLVQLSWEEMQEVVAGILRAIGYKTRISPAGSDRGKDIVASRDGLGLSPPRIIVEVKHRKNKTMGAPDIRSFIGGRHAEDKGLYVSTGGFSKDALYVAEQANIPLTLMDIDELVRVLLNNYESMDNEIKALLPLSKIYWPINI